ncbi:MAG: SRPBCC family protein [Rubrivivax sp.]
MSTILTTSRRTRLRVTPPPARRAFLVGAAAAVLTVPAAQAQEVQAKVERAGEKIVVDLKARVAAPLATTWGVLIDYERMPEFVSTLKTSKVTSRQGNQLEVSQTGETRVAFMNFKFATVRAVELLPMTEIRTKLVSGDFKSFDTVTRLTEEGGDTVIAYRGEYIPNAWVPPMLGPSVIAGETKRQYGQLLAEVLRRHAAAPAASPK